MNELIKIQSGLKAPKGQKNTFGNYMYRNCEDILEALKPLMLENKCSLIITDEIVQVGERYYVKATATLYSETDKVSATAFAREAEDKKGMDDSQITGSTSSYARKYALNGLFCIDDTKDADSRDNTAKGQTGANSTKPATNFNPEKTMEKLNDKKASGPVPSCSICGEKMKYSPKSGKFWCKHEADGVVAWGEPVYGKPMSDRDKEFVKELDETAKYQYGITE